jgi:hypothetical protein
MSDEEVRQTKRKGFQERNKIAARKCRMRRKKMVDDLEEKFKTVKARNMRLKEEACGLTEERQILKALAKKKFQFQLVGGK